MNKIFNTTFETSLRILLILSLAKENEMTLDKIAEYDFITIYSKYFHLSDIALHGENEFGLSEFAARRDATKAALHSMVLDGLTNVVQTQTGFQYMISDNGVKIVHQMTSDYANTYKYLAQKTMDRFSCMNEKEIANAISIASKLNLRR